MSSDKSCSCHINPPCSVCTEALEYCPECDWYASDDRMEYMNQYHCRVDSKTQTYTSYKLRELDPTKIDWHYQGHTHFSMIKKGVYPEGVEQKDVEQEVKGTFGGRFLQFGGGKFEYVAYTD